MNESDLIPQEGERSLVVGQTGTGKTVFVCWLLARIKSTPTVIYDTKIEPKFAALPHSRVVHSWDGVLETVDNQSVDYVVFRPSSAELSDPELLDEFLNSHYEILHKVNAYIDEIYSFHNNGRPGRGLIALLTRGRSKGITTIMSTQRPAWLSTFCITEAQKFYIFRLLDKKDKKRLADVIPDFDKSPKLADHHFFFYKSGTDTYHVFKPIKLDKKMAAGYVDQDQQPAVKRPVWI